jgi:alanine dehydrogenase
MHVTNLTSADIQPHLYQAVDVALRAGESTPRLEAPRPETFHARAGFLAYVAGQPDERALVPRLDLPAQVIGLPSLADLLAGRVPGRTTAEQTSFFLNVGAIGAQFEAVAAAVYRKAREQGLGTEIPTDWFLQDVRD